MAHRNPNGYIFDFIILSWCKHSKSRKDYTKLNQLKIESIKILIIIYIYIIHKQIFDKFIILNQFNDNDLDTYTDSFFDPVNDGQ